MIDKSSIVWIFIRSEDAVFLPISMVDTVARLYYHDDLITLR